MLSFLAEQHKITGGAVYLPSRSCDGGPEVRAVDARHLEGQPALAPDLGDGDGLSQPVDVLCHPL